MYHISSDNCDDSYIVEMGWSRKSRFMEHRRPRSINSDVSRHINSDHPDHSITLDNVRILEVELKWFERGVRESIEIIINSPTLNKDAGRYNLPLVWNNTLKKLLKEGGGTRSQDLQPGGVVSERPQFHQHHPVNV